MKLSATEAVADAEAEISQEKDTEGRSGPPRPRTRQDAVLNSPTSASDQRTDDHAIREFGYPDFAGLPIRCDDRLAKRRLARRSKSG